MNSLRVNEIVETITEQPISDKEMLFEINTSSVENGQILPCPLTRKSELKGQFKKGIKNNDILFSEIRPQNKHFYKVKLNNPEDYVASTKLMVLRKFNEDVDIDYFYYWLTCDATLNQLQSRAENRICSFPQITFELLSEYLVPIPTLKKQKNVSRVLNNLNLKIVNNYNTINTLESLAKTIYDYWFLQFEFPNEEGKPYKSSGGKMVWNNDLKREIPEGWEIKKLANIEKNIVTGKTPSTKDNSNFGNDVPFITIEDIRNNIFITNTSRKLSNKGAENQQRKYIREGSLCVSCIASLGEIGFATEKSQTNQQINSIVFNNVNNKEFLYFSLKGYFENSSSKVGNVFNNMNKEEFSNIEFLYNSDIIKDFHNKIEPLFIQILNCSKQNQQLTELRDFLLPMLMNGQVTFKDESTI